MGDEDKRQNVGPWAFFQGRPSGEARLSYKQAVPLRSGFPEMRIPKLPYFKISIIKRNNKTDGKPKTRPPMPQHQGPEQEEEHEEPFLRVSSGHLNGG